MYQALYRKWRPRTFDDVVGQSHITETLKRQVREGKLSHAYLFTGTRGTGKTTCAKILAKAANCLHPVDGSPCNCCEACLGIESGAVMEVLELDAASNNGVDQVRALRDEAVYSPASVRKRVYIVDEVHMLSTAAFNALLKILEEPPEHLMFILATTEIHKVPATIKSRCQQFAFKRISPSDIAARLTYVAGQEGIPLTKEGAALLARLADGGLRDALSLLDQCATGSGGGALGEGEILDALGLAGSTETARLMADIAARDTGAALERLDKLYAGGKDVGGLLGELSSLTRDLLIRKTAPRGGAGLLTGGFDEATLRSLSQSLTAPRLSHILGRLQAAQADLGRSTDRRTDAELCLIRLCDESLDDSAEGLAARLARLEEALAGGELPARPARGEEKSLEEVRSVQREAVKAPAEPTRQPKPAPAADLPPWDMEPPPAKEDLPPWDMEPSPAKREEAPKAPPASEKAAPAPRQAPAPQAPAAAPAESPSAPTEVGDFWPGLVRDIKGKIPMGEYSFLCKEDTAWGTIDGPVLTVWVKDDFTRSMLNKPGIVAALSRQAQSLPGGPYRTVITVGRPPAPGKAAPAEQKGDKFDELLALGGQLDNFIIKG